MLQESHKALHLNPKLNEIHAEARKRMDHGAEGLKKELSSVRTGRAHVDLLTPVVVNYYGTPTPLHQLATVSAPDPQMLLITPYDRSQVKEVEKAIVAAGLGLNAIADGAIIRVNVPPLTEERRKDLTKHVRKVGEEARVAIRGVRRDINEKIKKLEKGKEISQDEEKTVIASIQVETDAHIRGIDEMVQKKEKEVMTV
jgi:ribosome recycling factor